MLWYFPLEFLGKRYTQMMNKDLQLSFTKYGIKVTSILGSVLTDEIETGSFLDSESTNHFKFTQLQEICQIFKKGEVKDGDVFFFSDLWFPGIESIKYMAMFKNINIKICGIFHAGSWIDSDYVAQLKPWVHNIERGWMKMCDEIYIGSRFHKNEIQDDFKFPLDFMGKYVVTGLPFRPQDILTDQRKELMKNKLNIITFTGRLCEEKHPEVFDHLKEYCTGDFQFIKTMEHDFNKEEYLDILAISKFVFSAADQENFGYGVLEAFLLGCYPILPSKLVYPEFYYPIKLYTKWDNLPNFCNDLFQQDFKELNGYFDVQRKQAFEYFSLSSDRIAERIKKLLEI